MTSAGVVSLAMCGRKANRTPRIPACVHALQFVACDVFGDAGDAGCPALHVFERVDNHTVIRTVAGGLDDHVAPETQLVDEDFFLFLPGGRERFVLGFGRQRKFVEGADDVHVRVDGSRRHFEFKRIRIVVLLYVGGLGGHSLTAYDRAFNSPREAERCR